jgi:thiol-disulfide isomerase/thioredoxin
MLLNTDINLSTLSRTSAIILTLFTIATNAWSESTQEIPMGGYLPDVELHGLLVKSKKLSEYRGKPLIINMWASWCGPCQEEMASIQHLSTIQGGKRFSIIGISTDDDKDAAVKAMIKSKLTFENYIDRNLTFEHLLGADSIPLTIFIDAQGRIIKKIHGAQEWDSPKSLSLIHNTLNF